MREAPLSSSVQSIRLEGRKGISNVIISNRVINQSINQSQTNSFFLSFFLSFPSLCHTVPSHTIPYSYHTIPYQVRNFSVSSRLVSSRACHTFVHSFIIGTFFLPTRPFILNTYSRPASSWTLTEKEKERRKRKKKKEKKKKERKRGRSPVRELGPSYRYLRYSFRKYVRTSKGDARSREIVASLNYGKKKEEKEATKTR